MKKFINNLISDSNKVSSKRVIGLIALFMFISYGIKGLLIKFDLQFSIFYVSLCSVTIWIAFRFMTSEKAMKYDILGKLSRFGLKDAVNDVISNEETLDNVVQPDQPIEELNN